MERNGLVAFTLHYGTVLERLERLFLASGNGVLVFLVDWEGLVLVIHLN